MYNASYNNTYLTEKIHLPKNTHIFLTIHASSQEYPRINTRVTIINREVRAGSVNHGLVRVVLAKVPQES
jgi:hypothetical protein